MMKLEKEKLVTEGNNFRSVAELSRGAKSFLKKKKQYLACGCTDEIFEFGVKDYKIF